MRSLTSLFPLALPMLFCLLLLVSPASAQPDNPPPPEDTPVPITGLEFLLVAGGALGGYKLLRKDASKEN